ncbi:Glyoxylase, beta-lactamase superfamily II [Marinococcus luteus]|uniref:Glyoxylase, beta-lactamase superfamily II n=1 Tax=Marinococcus luteus TaxID=1122204 RepID=A0A1H2XPJ8_9BACI|nr:MBL fold metallo-hydrolase [Marinococcus luteus]SDW94725.1 Glyoxylase, beta-lactamase superfamily II [Marinococcus luteus]
MKLTETMHVLELSVPQGKDTMVLHLTLMNNNGRLILFDTGMPGYEEEIYELIRKENLNPDHLDTIILTHQDIDHIGSLPEILHDHPKLRILAHYADKPYVDGEEPLIKLSSNAKANLIDTLPEEKRNRVGYMLDKTEPSLISETVEEGNKPVEGLTAVHTPGHAPGHISLYHENSHTLIAGDALTAEDGELFGPRAEVTPDMEQAHRSLEKLLEFDMTTAVCYHGGIVHGDINQKIREILS